MCWNNLLIKKLFYLILIENLILITFIYNKMKYSIEKLDTILMIYH